MMGLLPTLAALSACIVGQPTVGDALAPLSPDKPLSSMVRAELRLEKTVVPVGGKVIIEFAVYNLTDEKVTLSVPGALVGKERPDIGVGLPLEHVFSGPQFRALEVASEEVPNMGDRVTRKPEYPIPAITLAPFGVAGLRFDATRFYPGLHQAGVYELKWKPYGGALEAPPVVVTVVPYKQVMMETEYGTLTLQLLYEKAPRHVANFLELIDRRFYNGKVFHLVMPNQFILGGSPDGNGEGKRPDGLTLEPEFNDTAFEIGTVGMALLPGDPHSGSCQFFICLSRQPGWDGRYTAFAQIAGPQSLATLRRIGETATDANRRPESPLIIKSMSAVDAPLIESR
jgi:cyclophilin family peptidyl-prolyl cis-trans isomerase